MGVIGYEGNPRLHSLLPKYCSWICFGTWVLSSLPGSGFPGNQAEGRSSSRNAEEKKTPTKLNLVPVQPGKTPSYWCTWGLQTHSRVDIDPTNRSAIADNLSERLLFEEPGWASRYFPKVRRDLYLLLDLGWDVPPGLQFDQERWRLGTLELAESKFPSCQGSPAERLRQLNSICKAAGWRGAGIRIAAQMPGDGKEGKLTDTATLEAYWRERARWSHRAGIEYWKVDYGARSGDENFRKLLTRIAREEAPGLLLEHARNCGPLNDERVPWEKLKIQNKGSYRTWDKGRILDQALRLLSFSDVLRTYDVTGQFSISTTLDRVAQILDGGSKNSQAKGVINCEDEMMIGAVLGCAVGVMRHPLWQVSPNRPYDPNQLRHRMDEVTRAVRWQRIAPAWPVGSSRVILDPTLSVDEWTFRKGETWADWLTGEWVVQSAPARVARGMSLAEVMPTGLLPFAITSRHPNGAVAVATLARVTAAREIRTPLADVAIDVGPGSHPVGIFGYYRSLTLLLSEPLGSRRVWAQDLAGEDAVDITGGVGCQANSIVLSGGLIRQVGLSAASPGDISDPGMVLVLSP
jgi:hypothetical protein